MKLLRVEENERNNYGALFTIVAEHGGKEWRKNVSLKDLWVQLDRKYIGYSFVRAVRELDRDIAFSEHGASFRNHCRFTSNFWGPLSESEQKEQYEFLAKLREFVEPLERFGETNPTDVVEE